MISVMSTQKYCCEDISKIENYDKAVLDADEIWEVHHRLEIQKDYTLSVNELKDMGMYYNRPACELVFLTKLDHIKIHKFQSEIASRGGRNGVGEAKARHRGKFCWTDGVHNKYSTQCPGEGWKRGMARSASKAMGEK